MRESNHAASHARDRGWSIGWRHPPAHLVTRYLESVHLVRVLDDFARFVAGLPLAIRNGCDPNTRVFYYVIRPFLTQA